MTVTRTQASVPASQGTLDCSVRTVRRGTSPMAPLAASPAAVTPLVLLTTSVTAQGCVCVRPECTAPSATNAIQGSSALAAQDASLASATIIPTTATHSLASV